MVESLHFLKDSDIKALDFQAALSQRLASAASWDTIFLCLCLCLPLNLNLSLLISRGLRGSEILKNYLEFFSNLIYSFNVNLFLFLFDWKVEWTSTKEHPRT